MNCKYYYKGTSFDSELELDDFLLNNGPEFIDKYGDIVGQEVTKNNLILEFVTGKKRLKGAE